MFTSTLAGSQTCESPTPTPICWPRCLVERSCRVQWPLSIWPILARLVSSSLSCLLVWASATSCFLEEVSSKGPSSVLPHPSTKTSAVLPCWVPLPIIPQSCYLVPGTLHPLSGPFLGKTRCPQIPPLLARSSCSGTWIRCC